MKTYFCDRGQGERDGGMPVMVINDDAGVGTYVADERGIPRSLWHHVYHSPDGFSWGYGGSGPSELARCILWDYLGREPEPALYHAFKDEFVATQPQGGPFRVEGQAIASWLKAKKAVDSSTA